MLSPDDRNAIEGLFDRLEDVERKAPPRDGEAEALIRQKIAAQPGAPYYMAQTVLVQEHALSVAERRINELEDELARRPQGGLLGGLFGDRGGYEQQRGMERAPARRQRGPWERDEGYGGGRGGGFLAGAAQTALGVTGGLLLGSAIAGMLGVGEANAAEAGSDPGADAGAGQGGDAGGDFGDGGADFGDGGGFDIGGDF